jgi:hypothetical protein
MSQTLKDVDLSTEPQEEQVEVEQPEQDKEPTTAGQALFAFAGGPDRATIEAWKAQYGEVLVAGFTPSELFIFRPLTRAEYVNLQTIVARSEKPVTQQEVEEKICDVCTLWASEPALQAVKTKAGSISTLHEQIMQASNFINPMLAGSYVTRL